MWEHSSSGCGVFVLRTSQQHSDLHAKQYRTRRAHKKSRAGCTVCRSKRLKCDEQRPACTYCARRKLCCSYQASPPDSRQSSDSPPSEILHLVRAEHALDALVKVESPERPIAAASTATLLYNHYEIMTSNGLLLGVEPTKYHQRMLSLAQDHPYLLHAQLAIAALHLTSSGVILYEKARLYNLSRTLQEYQRAIAKPIGRQDSDPLVMTSMMINMLYFHCGDSSEDNEHWLWSRSPQRLNWLSVQQGMGAILSQTRPHHCESGLLSNFYVEPKPVISGRRLLPAFWALCNVTDPIGPRGVHKNPYHDILHCLALLMPLEPGCKSLMKYMHFSGRIYPAFISLVKSDDHKALLILSYWFALLISVGDLWWCKLRAKRDCLAICAFLDLAGDETIRTLLDFPATSCAYTSRIQDFDESPDLPALAMQARCVDITPWLDRA